VPEHKSASRTFRRAAILAILIVMVPVSLYAHARLLRSVPANGAHLESPPATIRLVFSEPPMVPVSHIRLLTPAKDTITLGLVRKDSTDGHAVVVDVPASLKPGKYTVLWWTAATDGHPVNGSFTFDVAGSAARDTAKAATSTTAAPDPADLAAKRRAKRLANAVQFALGAPMWLARWLAFVALFIVVGAVGFRYFVLQPLAGAAAESENVFHRIADAGAASAGMLMAVVLAITTVIRLYGETVEMHEVSVRTILVQTSWGWAWVAQMVACVIAVVAFAIAHRGNRVSWPVAAACAFVLTASPALTGHAVSSDESFFAVPVDIVHVIAGSAWLGTLALILFVGIGAALKAPDGDSVGARVATLVNGFSPLALVCGATVVGTGVATSLFHVDRWSRLWTTSYGMTLIVKLALVSLLFSLGAWNWRRVKPNLGGDAGVVALRFSAKLELAASLLVLAVTAFLVALPLPD
jgi:copper transport protein